MAKESRVTATTSNAVRPGYQKVFEQIYRMVLRIPRGRVMTYGQIARVMDDRYSPRLVGWAMHATPRDGREIPWHRVINSRGTVSTGRIILDQPDLQRLLLEAEGITFDDKGRCDLDRYQWSPSTRKARAVVRLARGGSKQLSKNRKVPSRPAKRSRKGVRT